MTRLDFQNGRIVEPPDCPSCGATLRDHGDFLDCPECEYTTL